MKIWVDADACPVPVKDIVIKAGHKLAISSIFVANKVIALPLSPHLIFVQVAKGADVADQYIVDQATKDDLVITQDILPATSSKEIVVIDPRGHAFTEENIGERVSVRALMTDLRDSGDITGGPKQYTDKDKQRFASAFDRAITKLNNRAGNK
jgi:hypothetical protein